MELCEIVVELGSITTNEAKLELLMVMETAMASSQTSWFATQLLNVMLSFDELPDHFGLNLSERLFFKPVYLAYFFFLLIFCWTHAVYIWHAYVYRKVCTVL